MPSSSKSWRARLGPRPGRRVRSMSPGGNFARSFSAAGMVPVSSSARIFSSSVLPMPGSSVDAALARERADRHRGVAHGLGRGAVGEHAVDDGAVELVEVAELVEARRRWLSVGVVGTAALDVTRAARPPSRPAVARPADLRRGPEHRGDRARRSRCSRRPRRTAPHPRRRRRLARRHGRDRRRLGRASTTRSRSCTAPRARASAPRTSRASPTRCAAAPATCSRWTPTSRTTRRPRRGCSRARDGGADLALGSRYVAGGGVEDWGLVRRLVSRGGSSYARRVLGAATSATSPAASSASAREVLRGDRPARACARRATRSRSS